MHQPIDKADAEEAYAQCPRCDNPAFLLGASGTLYCAKRSCLTEITEATVFFTETNRHGQH